MRAEIQFISAGAGSGKTYTITEALNNALLVEDFTPDSIFATTFTTKAAQELLQRVREKVLQTVSNQPEKHELALQINQAKIGTLHSLCAIYVERFAFELGLSPSLNIIDEQHAEQLLYEVFEQLAEDVNNQRLIERAVATGLRFGFGKADFKGDATTIVDLAVKLVQEARANAITPTQFAHMAQESIADYQTLLSDPTTSTGPVTLADYLVLARKTTTLLEHHCEEKGKKIPAWLDELRAKSFVDTEHFKWSDWEKVDDLAGKTILHLTQPLIDLKLRLSECIEFQNDINHFIEDVFALAEAVAAKYEGEKRRIGFIDFADLEAYFLKIIQNANFLDAIAPEFAFVLVDEFQDTNPMQLAIYSELFQVARKVVLVGDLKQAIYGFRGASPELMELLINKLRDEGQEIRSLKDSWRSTTEVLTYCNSLFKGMFNNEDVALNCVSINSWQIPTEQVLPAVSNWRLEGKNAEILAADLCHKLLKIMKKPPIVPEKRSKDQQSSEPITTRPISWRDIVILENSHFDIRSTVAALQQVGIPAVAMQSGLIEQAEIVLALAALQLAVEPHDSLAQAEFITLYQQNGLQTWLKDRLQPTSSVVIAESARQILDSIYHARLHCDPAELLSLVITQLKLADVIVSWDNSAYQSEQRLANLDALLSYAQDYCRLKLSMRLPVSVNGLFNFMKQKAKKDLDLQQGSAGDAIQVMTVHAAKGLEWPLVIANFLNKPIKHRLFSIKALNESENYKIELPLKGRTLRFLPSYKASRGNFTEKQSLENRMLKQPIGAFEEQQALAEAQRELYVAFTRAKNYLILTSPSGKPSYFSYLDKFSQILTGVRNDLSWLEPVEKTEQQPIRWRSIAPLERVSRKITPSAVHGGRQLSISNKFEFGQQVHIPAHVSANQQEIRLGQCIHQLIGWAVYNPAVDLESRCAMLLNDFGVRDDVFISKLSRNINAFIQHLQSKGVKSWHCELPVNVINALGQEISGSIDLLIQLEDGWLVVDHKLFSGKFSESEYLQNYEGQLLAYRDALELAGIPKAQLAIHAVTKGTLYMLADENLTASTCLSS